MPEIIVLKPYHTLLFSHRNWRFSKRVEDLVHSKEFDLVAFSLNISMIIPLKQRHNNHKPGLGVVLLFR